MFDDDSSAHEDISLGLTSSDVDYCFNTNVGDIPQTFNIEKDVMFSNCDKANLLEGEIPIQNSDQFVQLSTQSTNVLEGVCNPISVSILPTNTCTTTTTNILSQLADLKLVDSAMVNQDKYYHFATF